MSAAQYKVALAKALSLSDDLSAELRQRCDREEELLNAISTLLKPLLRLSGTLKGCNGDFGVVDYEPDPQVDRDLINSRPALIVHRCAFIMNMALQRIEKLHGEAEDAGGVTSELLESLAQLESIAQRSKATRRGMLVTGMMIDESDNKRLDELEDEYQYSRGDVTGAQVYEVEDEGVGMEIGPETTIDQRHYMDLIKRCEERHRRVIG